MTGLSKIKGITAAVWSVLLRPCIFHTTLQKFINNLFIKQVFNEIIFFSFTELCFVVHY